MAKRQIGTAVVRITYHNSGDYRGTVSVNVYSGLDTKGAARFSRHTWAFRDLRAPAAGLGEGVAYDSPEAYDRMALSACGFGSHWEPGSEAEGFPPRELAQAICDATGGGADDAEVTRLR